MINKAPGQEGKFLNGGVLSYVRLTKRSEDRYTIENKTAGIDCMESVLFLTGFTGNRLETVTNKQV